MFKIEEGCFVSIYKTLLCIHKLWYYKCSSSSCLLIVILIAHMPLVLAGHISHQGLLSPWGGDLDCHKCCWRTESPLPSGGHHVHKRSHQLVWLGRAESPARTKRWEVRRHQLQCYQLILSSSSHGLGLPVVPTHKYLLGGRVWLQVSTREELQQ